MDVTLGACGFVIAILCVLFGMGEVGLWVACYFRCPDGKEIEFNYFAAVWTGALAFAIGFMILVLFCVKFKNLGTFIIVLTFLLVPCEIICACLYAYRAYLSRPDAGSIISNVGQDYFSVFMYSAMSVCAVFLFVVTVMWNCYYCCIATPVEDYEEEVKEDLEEEEARQQAIRSAQDRLINNPIIDDDIRIEHPRTLTLTDPRPNRHRENSHVRFPNASQNLYPDAMQNRHVRGSQYLEPYRNGPDRRDNRGRRDLESAQIRDEYPYPPAFMKGPAQQQGNRKAQNQMRVPRPQVNYQPNTVDTGNGRGQVNRAFEPGDYGRPSENTYNLRSYLYDGMDGGSFERATQQGRHSRGDQPQSQQSQSVPSQYGANPGAATDSRYHYAHQQRQQQHMNRDPNIYGQRPTRNAASEGALQQRNLSYAHHIYRPRPENFRGKPPEPEYLRQQRAMSNRNNVGAETSQHSAFRSTGAADAYF